MAEALQSTGQASAGTGQLRRNALGVAAITFFVVSAAAPLTAVAGGYPIAMLLGNGAGVPAAVVLVTLILLVFSVGYTAMARHIANAGSFFAFTSRGLGGVAGGAAAYIALLAYNTMQIGLYGLFGAVTAGTLAGYGIELPWWVWSLIALAIVGLLGYRQIDLSAKVLAVLVILEYAAVVILDLAIVGKGGAAGIEFSSFTPGAFFTASPTIGVLLCFAAFMGFEATTIYSEEARDPKRTVPRATYLAVLIIGVFYAISTWAMVLGVGADKVVEAIGTLPDPTLYVFTLSDQYVGGWLTTVMSVLLVTSVFAALLAFHNAAARYFYVLGREGLLPAKLGNTHDAHQSPHSGSVLQTVLGIVVLAIFAITQQDPIFALFTWLTNTATLSVITLMALVSFAVLAFFKKQPALEPSALKASIAPLFAGVVLAIIAILVVVNFGLLTGAAPWLAIALPVLVPVAAVLGVLAASNLKQSDPARFARLGAHQTGAQ